MTFNIAILMQAEGSDARAEITAVGNEAKKTSGAVKGMGTASKTTSTQTKGLGSSADQAEARIKGLTSAATQNAAATKALGQANRVAAGQTANLVAQGNDVMVMMMAGQNPLQLAMQQGTQISQVIGPMGAAGAFKALGGAVLGMLNPISLVTIGSIAAGAAMINWLRSSKDETRDLDEILSDITQGVADFNSASENLSVDNIDTLKSKYGQINSALIEMLEAQRSMAEFEALDDLSEAQKALAESTEEVFGALGRLDQKGRTLKNAYKDLQREFGLTRDEVDTLKDAVNAAAEADGPEAAAAAYKDVRQLIMDAVRYTGDLTDEQETLLKNLLSAEDAARRFSAIDMTTGVTNAANEAARMASEVIKAVEATQALKSQAGVDLETAQLRLDYKDSPIELARQLAINKYERKQEPLRAGASPLDLVGLNNEAQSFGDIAAQVATLDQQRIADLKSSRSSAVASSSATAKQRAATNDLISSLQDELAILQTTDPVQKELLRNRDALTGATDAERQTIGDLIAQRNQETQTLAQQSETWTELRSTAYGFFTDLRNSGGDLEQTFANLANGIADMVMQAALLGEGPLAGILGGGDGGGLIGTALSAIFPALAPAAATAIPARAEGGMVHGKGGPKSDQVLMWGSNGEFMMNAKATAKNRHLLEVLNAGGSLPGLANGGAINGSQSGGASVINILPMNNSSVPLNMEVEETTDARGQKTLKVITSDMVADGMGLRGGKAERVMQSKFGARKQGIGRS